MSDPLDFKKEDKNLYQPKTIPVIVDVPKMTFIMVDGEGNPNDESGEYAKAIGILYKMSSAANHDGHNNLFESDATSEYAKDKNLEYKEICERYGGGIPDDIKEEYYEGIDRFRTSELDAVFMDGISLFFEKQ